MKKIIPILSLALIVAAVPVGIRLAGQNQANYGRATVETCLSYQARGCTKTPCCNTPANGTTPAINLSCLNDVCVSGTIAATSIDCTDIMEKYNKRCGANPSTSTAKLFVPCNVFKTEVVDRYCSDTAATPTLIPTPKVAGKQVKCVGRFLFTYNNGKWDFLQVCQKGCENNKCIK